MHVQLQSISKRFGSQLAVDAVDFEARPGDVTALLGENGAGKSTLMKLLYGLLRPDAGRIVLDGRSTTIGSPRDAMAAGIGMVFQQFSLIPALTVRENLALVQPQAPWWIGRGARRLAVVDRHLQTLVPEVDPAERVADLPVGRVQLVELAKALLGTTRCLILDEPSAVLAPQEAARLWQLVRALAARGLSVVLITHKLHDVQACADRVVVLRAGRLVLQQPARGMDARAIVQAMVGQEPPPVAARTALAAGAPPRLWIRQLRAGNAHGIDLQLRAGEVLGIAGVSGNGQTALAEALGGVRPLEAGEVILDGMTVRAPRLRPPAAPRLGYIPEQVLLNGVAPALSVALNLALVRLARLPWWPRRGALQAEAEALIARYDIRPRDPLLAAQALSGGNLQKLVVARELSAQPAAVVACYPTMGLDVAATARIHGELFALAARGTAVLWISEDLDDLLRHAHRIAVLLQGRVVRVFEAEHASLAALGACMTGAAAELAA